MDTHTGSAAAVPTYIIDGNSVRELTRQLEMERAQAALVGAPFADVEGLPAVRDVLDVACGPGGWALEVAASYPHARITGIDISPPMINFARACAQVRGLGNARFVVMDATSPLEFPDCSFNVVNARGLSGFMLTRQWAPFLLECRRILRPGGILSLAEYEAGASSSPAHEELLGWFLKAMARGGRSFSSGDGLLHLGITLKLRPLLQEAGFQNVQTRSHHLDYSYGCPLHEPWTAGLLTLADLLRPFLVESGVATCEELAHKSQQMAAQMQSPQFCAFLTYLTTWGAKQQGQEQDSPRREAAPRQMMANVSGL